MTADAKTIATAITLLTLVGAVATTYRRQRYWERRVLAWHGRLTRQIGALRILIRDARETQEAFRAADAPAALHAAFIGRCDAVLRSECGAAYALRVDQRLSEAWLQPPGLASEEHIFAWYDTERRIAGLQELINEAADDLAVDRRAMRHSQRLVPSRGRWRRTVRANQSECGRAVLRSEGGTGRSVMRCHRPRARRGASCRRSPGCPFINVAGQTGLLTLYRCKVEEA